MVDVSTRIEGRPHVAAGTSITSRQESAGPAVTVFLDEDAVDAYRAGARDAVFSPPQSPAWIGAWVAETRPDLVVATVTIGGMPAAALALEAVKAGPFRVARFLAGSHANGNFAPVAAHGARLRRADVEAMFAAIRAARPDIDMIAMERMPREHAGVPNPFLPLSSGDSPNVSLAADLEGGFDALLDRSSSKRRRKKHRAQVRKFEAAGGYRIVEAKAPDEIDAALDAFYAMKRVRLTRMGVENVFGTAEVQAFFRRLFKTAAADDRPAFVLHMLEVGGVIRAVTGSSRTDDRIICEFGGITEDELAYASPGDFLSFELIHAACEEGLAFYDFSVGDEFYKRLWCDVETWHFDVFVPLTLKGRLLALGERGKTRLKAFVKNNEAMWSLVKKLRRRDRAHPAEALPED